LDKILENTQHLINSDKINLKDKQKQKTLIQINRLKKHEELDNLLTTYKKTQKTEEELKNRIKNSKINKEISSAKQQLIATQNTIENEKQRINKLKNYLETTVQNISRKTEELETALGKISGKDVSLRL
ncbi:MAG: hypothetical protein U9P44_03605, partial [archaeon]|nr:hypothetical protein [archaeon]